MHYLLSIYINNYSLHVSSRLTAHHEEVLLCIYGNWYMSCVYVDWLLAGSGWMHRPQNFQKSTSQFKLIHTVGLNKLKQMSESKKNHTLLRLYIQTLNTFLLFSSFHVVLFMIIISQYGRQTQQYFTKPDYRMSLLVD